MSSERERILQAAQKHVDKKRFDRAIEEYQKIVQKDPNDARTLLKIGDLQTRMQNYTDAVATYDRVGRYYADQGFALKAISVYKQIRELIKKQVPELAERYSHILPKLAEIYAQLGLTSDALAAYDEVATRLQRGGRDRDAIEIFDKMVELDATNPLPHLRLAEACCRVQRLDQAIDSFWTAAELLLKLDRQDDALKVIERILHFRPDPKYAKLAAELYLRGGQREDGLQALAKLQICFQADPKNLETLGLLAQAFTVLGQEAKATEVYKEMARIAREAGRNDLFEQLVAHLVRVAPGDEQVRALQALPAVQPAREASAAALNVQDSDLELIEDEAPASQEAPFELNRAGAPQRAERASQHGPEVVITNEQVAPADEVMSAEAFDAQAYSRKAIIDAESFRRLKLYSKALETLRIALEIDPGSTEVRQKLREVLLEAGDRDGAIGESVTLAAMLLERGSTEHAEMLLYDVLDMEPGHPAALEMLQQLTTGDTQYGYAEEPPTAHYPQPAPYPAGAAYDPNAPLPSYDLEEIAPSRAMASADPIVADDVDLNSVDDPFAATDDESFGVEAPLPSFPLGADEDELMAGLDAREADLESAPRASAPIARFDEPDEKTQLVDLSDDVEEVIAEPEEEPSEAIEEALEEAEFFTSRGLFDDAQAILNDQLSRTPNHPLVLERLHELELAAAKSGESRTIDRSQLGPRDEAAEGDHAFDIAASLDALDELDGTLEPEAGSFANANQEVDVDQVFAKFKEGVRAQVSESDSATHYDLGVAYKEMGLLPDAIHEFELAGRDPARECMCYAMIGMIDLELGELDNAASAYVRALEAPEKNVDQEMSLYYDLGNVYEMKKSPEEALYYFKKIARRDPGYRDVTDRIAALEPGSAEQPAGARVVNDEDEFDRAFDELFETK